MRREERHHLKENPVATFVTQFQRGLAGDSRTLGGILVAIVVALVAVGGYYYWQAGQANQAGEQLSAALLRLNDEIVAPPEDTSEEWTQPEHSFPSETARLEAVLPQLLAVADQYPNRTAGIIARYEAAAALVLLDRVDDAATQYEQVIAADQEGLHGSMARLGLAETHVLRGDYAGAVDLLQPEADAVEPSAPVDAVLMRIGRAYELAGQDTDAVSAFTRVVEEFPFSIYSSQARQKIDALESSSDAAASTSG